MSAYVLDLIVHVNLLFIEDFKKGIFVQYVSKKHRGVMILPNKNAVVYFLILSSNNI